MVVTTGHIQCYHSAKPSTFAVPLFPKELPEIGICFNIYSVFEQSKEFSITFTISYNTQFLESVSCILLPAYVFVTGGISINSMYVNEAFCVTGSDDGFLRLWPLDFKSVYLEAGRELKGTPCILS